MPHQRDIPYVFACIYLHGFSSERSSESNTAEIVGSTRGKAGFRASTAHVGGNRDISTVVAHPQTTALCLIPMHRPTARLLLLIVAFGILQPFLEAYSAEPLHACCLRRLHARSDLPAQFRDAKQANGNCCPPLITPHTARAVHSDAVSFLSNFSSVNSQVELSRHAAGLESSNSTRAPPSSFV